MSSTSRILTKLEEQLPQEADFDQNDIMADEYYTKKLSQLITDALQKGYDVMQLPSGDVIITEVKTVTYQYNWDQDKARFERAKSGSRSKRRVSVAGNANSREEASVQRAAAPAKELEEEFA